MSPKKKSQKKSNKRKSSSSSNRRSTKTRATRRSGSSPAIDEVVTTTRVRTEPKVEVRRAATLAQALTEPAVAVVKPETRVVERKIRTRRAA